MTGDPQRHRCEGEDRRERCHEDRSQTLLTTGHHGFGSRQSLRAILVHQVDEHDRVRDHDADEHQHTDQRCNAQRHARRDLQQDRAGRRERHRHQQQQRLPQRLESRDHDDVDDQDRREHREPELRERISLLRGDAADLGRSAIRQVNGLQGRGHRCGRRGEVVRRRRHRDGRRAPALLGRDRGRPLGLLDGRDILQFDDSGSGRDLQRAQLVDGGRRFGCCEVHRQRGVIEFDRSDLLRTHRARDERADGDLRETALRGGLTVDDHGDVGQGCCQVVGDLTDAVPPVELVAHGRGRFGERLAVRRRDVHFDVRRTEAGGGVHADLSDIFEVVSGVQHVGAQLLLIDVGRGHDRVRHARSAGERIHQG